MFDSVGAFKKQFTPVEGGYLIYPSRESGGKLITIDEYDRLVPDWERIAGRAGIWNSAGILVLVVALWTLLSPALSLPEWMEAVFPAAVALTLSAWVFWASMAPRRLVKNRPAVTPARPARKQVTKPGLRLTGLSSSSFFLSAEGPSSPRQPHRNAR